MDIASVRDNASGVGQCDYFLSCTVAERQQGFIPLLERIRLFSSCCFFRQCFLGNGFRVRS